jgi:hypothetical protein
MKAIRELKSAGVEPEVTVQNQIKSKEIEKPERREGKETEGSNLPKEERSFPVWKFDFNRVIPFRGEKSRLVPCDDGVVFLVVCSRFSLLFFVQFSQQGS